MRSQAREEWPQRVGDGGGGRCLVRVIGHRGAAASPENTLESIELALGEGADGIECDVRRTADGVLVLLHDQTVDRTTDGTGPVARMSWANLGVLDAGYHYRDHAGRPAWRGRGVRVPTVVEALNAVAGRGQVVLEIKGHSFEAGHDPADDTPEMLADLLARRAGDDVIVSSVNYVALARLRGRYPGVRTALLVPAGLDPFSAVETALRGGHAELHIAEALVDARLIGEARAAGVGVVAWTVNEPSRVCELGALGADGVITDDPRGARAALEKG